MPWPARQLRSHDASLVVDAPACSGRQNLLSVSVTSSAELDECEYPLPALSVRFRQPPGKEDLPELAIAEARIQFDDRGVNQKQNEDPDLYGCEAVPGEVSHHIFGNSA